MTGTTAVTSQSFAMVTHLQNFTGFRNLELDMLSDVKSTGEYWLIFVFLTSRDKNKTVLLRDAVYQIFIGESAVGADLPARRLLTPLGGSDGPYHVTTQFYYYIEYAFNSLASGRSQCSFENSIFYLVQIDILRSSAENYYLNQCRLKLRQYRR